jgi:hypothetical protein
MNKTSGALRTTRSITKARDKGGTSYAARKTKPKNLSVQEGIKRNSDETTTATTMVDMEESLEGEGILEDTQSLHVTDSMDTKNAESCMETEEDEGEMAGKKQPKGKDPSDIRSPKDNPHEDPKDQSQDDNPENSHSQANPPQENEVKVSQLSLKTAQKLKIPMDKVPGDSPKDKTKLVSKRMGQYSSYLGNTVKTIRGIPVIEIEFENAEEAEAACEIHFSKEEGSHFSFFIQDLPQPQKDQIPNKSNLVIIRDIPLEGDTDLLEDVLSKWGELDRVEYRLIDMWKTGLAYFRNEKDARRLAEFWSLRFGKDSLRILPGEEERSALQERSKWVVKVTNLPMGTKAFNIQEIQEFYGAKTLYIPRTLTNNPQRFAYMAFDQEEKYDKALNTSIQVGRFTLYITYKDKDLCYKCGRQDHKVVNCEEAHQQRYRRERARHIKDTQDKISKGEPLNNPFSYAAVLKGHIPKASAKNPEREELEQRLDNLELAIQSLSTAITEIWDYIRTKEDCLEDETATPEEPMDDAISNRSGTPNLTPTDIRNERSPPPTTTTDPRGLWTRQDNLERTMNHMTSILGKVAEKLNLNQP